MLVYSQCVQETNVPEDDVETVNCPPRDREGTLTQPQAEANKEHHDGQKVTHVEIVAEPHLYFLAYFTCFRHKHLRKERDTSKT